MIHLNFFLMLLFFVILAFSQQVYISNGTSQTFIIKNGLVNQIFVNTQNPLSCSMPNFYIYQDYTHNQYKIISNNVQLKSIVGKYDQISSSINCAGNDCVALINNQCPSSGKNSMNWLTITTTNEQKYEYLVNCFPTKFYKPFQWGLFLLLILSTIIISISSLYSKAWSYGGLGINVTSIFIIVFNGIVIIGTLAAYFIPSVVVIALNIIGSIIGTFGVMVCLNQSLWLLKIRMLSKKLFWIIRIIDLISFGLSSILMIVFWVFGGNWIFNNVFAICTIIASIKIFKIRAFKEGVILLMSLLLIQISVGLFVHYGLEVSYNNLVINQFQSPIVIVLPSITPQLYRRCAWLPITALIFPGLMLSYLRRFDLSRSTFLYLIIGYVSFYLGSIIWMLIDTFTVHSLPFAIFSEPVTIIIVLGVSYRRNEMTTLWGGFFYDNQLPQMSQELLPSQKQVDSDIQIKRLQQMTSNLRIQNIFSSDDMHEVYVDKQAKDQL